MIAMSREQMIRYLKDYAEVQNLAVIRHDLPICEAFKYYMISNGRFEDNTREYYDRMRRVYELYNYLKLFSINEDFLLNRDDFLNNNDLAGIEADFKFIEKPANISNKRIVQLIRDAFNHNYDDGIERFRISQNAKNVEIEFKDIRTQNEIKANSPVKPFKMKFSFSCLTKIDKIINEKRQNQLFLSFDIPEDFDIFSPNLDSELDKIKFVHYYFNNKLPRNIIDKFNDFSNTNGLSNEELLALSNEANTLSTSINPPVKFSLDAHQKRELKKRILWYRNNNPKILHDDINAVMFDLLQKVIPVPAVKTEDIRQQLLLCYGYFEDDRFSINEIVKRVLRVVNGDGKSSNYDEFDCEIHDILESENFSYQRSFFKNLADGNFMQLYPFVTYIDSVVTHCCKEDFIEIDGIIYNRKEIRNSFAHSRWYITSDSNIIMYDADPRNINDYNLREIGVINVWSFKTWADTYMEELNRTAKRT
jgi:hypothetical protein